MEARHWTEQELLDRIYGLETPPDEQQMCPDSLRRWKELQHRRSGLLSRAPEVSPAFLVEQRGRICRRLERQRFLGLGYVPALAAMLVLVAGLLLWRAGTPPPVPPVQDAQLFEDVFALVATTEPAAVEPIRSLFEVKP